VIEFNIETKFESLDREIKSMKRQIEKLLMQSHPSEGPVVCDNCKCKLKGE
tara:strand:+ start:176 stop:328 length:153 start_codon:yes stop_codon:yes gene_type:complete